MIIMESTFSASVQYYDLKGSVAADEADLVGVSTWLKNNNHITDEMVVGVSLYVGGSPGKWEGSKFKQHGDSFVSVHFFVAPMGTDTDEEPVSVRQIDVEMNTIEFFALFKRFSITLSRKGNMEGKVYSVV